MAKVTLDIEYEYDFDLIGISCHSRDYRICWLINNQTGLNFSRQENIRLKTRTSASEFAHYTCEDEDSRIEYSLIANKGIGGILIPEQKQADFFIKITGSTGSVQIAELIKKIKEIDAVLTAFKINIDILKSKQNLLIE